MKMEVLAVQQQYQSKYNIYGSSKVRDWTSTLSPLLPLSSCVCMDSEPAQVTATPAQQPTASIPIPYLQNQQNYHHHHQQQQQHHHQGNSKNNNLYNNNNNNNNYHNNKNIVNNKNVKNSIMHHNNKKTKRTASTEELLAVPEVMIAPPSSKELKKMPAKRTASVSSTSSTSSTTSSSSSSSSSIPTLVGGSYLTTQHTPSSSANLFNLNCDDIDAAAVNDLSARLLDELRAAKQRHLTCTEVSLPCDLTLRIAAEIIRVSEKEPCGIRGCTIYIEFEDEPNNSRRIAELKLDPEMVSTFEIYLTLRQDHRGWTSLLPQFMKSLARTITISPTFTITKHKLYAPDRTSYSYGSTGGATTATISAQTS